MRRLSREITTKLHLVLDDYLPPRLRASRVMTLALRWAFGRGAAIVEGFKERAPGMSEAEFADPYRSIRPYAPVRPTDMSAASVQLVLERVLGSVLEVGCGWGYLAERIHGAGHPTVAVDLALPPGMASRAAGIRFAEGRLPTLPFPNRCFDTVVCAHTLEHVRNLTLAVVELRRVCLSRLIVVVPRQRPYRYTFDLHLHFFPYPWSLALAMGGRGVVHDVGGDLLYVEDL